LCLRTMNINYYKNDFLDVSPFCLAWLGKKTHLYIWFQSLALFLDVASNINRL
jgi:hypothetical protein